MLSFIAANIDRWRDDFHYQVLWDRQPADVQSPKHDFPDDETLAIRRELEFIAYDCT